MCMCARVHVCMHACGHVCPHPPLFVLHFFFNVHIIHVYIQLISTFGFVPITEAAVFQVW